MQRHVHGTEPALRFAEGLRAGAWTCPAASCSVCALAKASAFFKSAKSLRYGFSPTRQ
jgi:hypothetical protein